MPLFINTRLKEERKRHKLTQLELSIQTKISVAKIRSYEQGKQNPNNSHLATLANALYVSTGWLQGIDTQLDDTFPDHYDRYRKYSDNVNQYTSDKNDANLHDHFTLNELDTAFNAGFNDLQKLPAQHVHDMISSLELSYVAYTGLTNHPEHAEFYNIYSSMLQKIAHIILTFNIHEDVGEKYNIKDKLGFDRSDFLKRLVVIEHTMDQLVKKARAFDPESGELS